MVASLRSSLLALDSTGMTSRRVGKNQGRTGSLLTKAMQHHALRRRKQMARTKRIGGGTVAWKRRQLSRKKWALLEGSRKKRSHVGRRIKKLRRLLPNGEESMGLEELFCEAADYIMCLQMQVKVMQIMVSVSSPMDSGD